jgi:hypothetical protein
LPLLWLPAAAQSGGQAGDLLNQKLLAARRIYIEPFGEDPLNKALTAMTMDALRASKRLIVTENREKADLILKGIALEKVSQEVHASGSATTVAGAASSQSASIHGSASGGSAHLSGSGSGHSVAQALGMDDSELSTETVESARLSVRLVSPDGDVVWSTTQESRGAKFKSAGADAAEKVVRELARELDKLARPAQ